jgi:DNA recombination protein RmuC
MSERVAKLKQHFGQANEDVRQIAISTEKIEQRGDRIEDVDFEEDGVGNIIPAPIPRLQAGE